MATWRSRHVNMVHRMIGLRVGTGGSTGKAYLKGAMDSHYIFSEIADLSSFLFERRKLPALPDGFAEFAGLRGYRGCLPTGLHHNLKSLSAVRDLDVLEALGTKQSVQTL